MTERTANQALEQSARSTFVAGRNFHVPGPVRTYRKPSLMARILRALGL